MNPAKGWQDISTAPKNGKSVRLKGVFGERVGRFGQHGSVEGWISGIRGGEFLIWPEPVAWADLSYRDKPAVREALVDSADGSGSARINDGNIKEWSCIYVIGCKEISKVKIGFSADPERRMRSMQIGCPYILNLYGASFGPELDIIAIERLVHKNLKSQGAHYRGEWFSVSPHEAMEAIAGASRQSGLFLSGASDFLERIRYQSACLMEALGEDFDDINERMARLVVALAKAA